MKAFRTVGGNEVELDCRARTNDENVCTNVIARDEYRLAELNVRPRALVLDIGAYIGAFTIAAIADFDARVVAVEPIEENVEQIKANIAQNGMWENAVVRPLAAGRGRSERIGVGYRGLNHYVGNLGEGPPSETRKMPTYSLTHFIREIHRFTGEDTLGLMKVDCEGCEWGFLEDSAVGRVEVIVGELHGDGDIEALLHTTHHVEMIGDYIFRAVRL